MSITDPTHPKITEDVDDVEGHVYRRSVLPDEPQPEGLARVKKPQERAADDDEVEGHVYRRMVVPDDDEDVEGHASRGKL